ncbi:MAG TPA: hypothetical protein VI194_17290 [Mycobacterium sp.]
MTRARSARQYVDGADEYFAMARVSEEVGRLLYGLREDLDDIDSRAHEDIQRIQQSMGVGKAGHQAPRDRPTQVGPGPRAQDALADL